MTSRRSVSEQVRDRSLATGNCCFDQMTFPAEPAVLHARKISG
jgi:hypothetical protein